MVIAGHSGILAAVQELGPWQTGLYAQVTRLKRACGGPLVNRPRPAGTAILAPLGQLLCQQARDYLGHQPAHGQQQPPRQRKDPHPPQRDLPEPLRSARRRAG